MKSLMVSVLTAAVLMGAFSAGSRGPTASAQAGDAPWQVGHCYRIVSSEPNTLYTFRILEAPRGNWVRAEEVPSMKNVIPNQAPLWINVTSPFAVQEWSCKG
jgi:hypothetical protein